MPKETAIPRGRYEVVIDYSNRFQRLMPHILNVPQFDGVRIHWGNYPVDTEGCPLIGLAYDAPSHSILQSKLAFGQFFPKLDAALAEGRVWVDIT